MYKTKGILLLCNNQNSIMAKKDDNMIKNTGYPCFKKY